MNRLKNHLIAAAVLIVLAVIGTIMNSHQAAAQGPPNGVAVNIVNPLPVPVTGSTTVSGSVAAKQSGAWSVSSRPDLPASPFGVTVAGVNPTVPVPAGRYLVIETLSIQTDVTPGKKIVAFVNYTSGGNSVSMFVPLTFSYTTGTFDFYQATQDVRLYADPGTVVSLEAATPAGGVSGGTSFLTVSGYLI